MKQDMKQDITIQAIGWDNGLYEVPIKLHYHPVLDGYIVWRKDIEDVEFAGPAMRFDETIIEE